MSRRIDGQGAQLSDAAALPKGDGADLAFRYSRLETPQTPAELRRLCFLAIAAAEPETDVALKRAMDWGAASLASQAKDMERRALERGQSDPQSTAS